MAIKKIESLKDKKILTDFFKLKSSNYFDDDLKIECIKFTKCLRFIFRCILTFGLIDLVHLLNQELLVKIFSYHLLRFQTFN